MANPNVAVVTGITGGIGGAVGEALMERDFTVVGGGRNPKALGELARKGILTKTTDICDLDQVQGLMATAAEVGDVRVVVNAAGVSTLYSFLGSRAEASTAAVMGEVNGPNLKGAAHVLLAGLEAMMTQDPKSTDGRTLFNVTSAVAVPGKYYPVVSEMSGAYGVAKSGGNGLVRAIAASVDASTDIACIAVAPQCTPDTIMGGDMPEDLQEALATGTLGGRNRSAAEVAGMIVGLATGGGAKAFNGQILVPAGY